MALRARAVVLALAVLLQVSLAQLGPDQRWLTPDGSKPDFSSTYNVGDTLTVSWTTLNSSKSDLWLTHWDSTTYPWHYQVAANVDISTAGTLTWAINVPASTIQADNRFVLRFYPLNSAYTVLQFSQNDSPGFILTGGVSNSSSASSSSSSAKASSSKTSTAMSSSQTTSILTTTNAAGSTIVSTVTTSSPTSTGISGSSQTTAASSSSGLSVASQAGIGVGVGLSVIILFAAGCFFGRRFGMGKKLRRSDHGLEGELFPMHQNKGVPYSDNHYSPSELGGSKVQGSDRGDTATLMSNNATYQSSHQGKLWAEMSGDNIQPTEKSGSMVRPGVHELG